MKLLDLILGRDENANWKRVPEHTTNQAVLILAKAMLMDAEVLTDSAVGYAEESAFSKGTRWYVSTITETLGRVLDECQALVDTPVGDHTMLDALALAKTQLEAAGKNYSR